MKRTTPTVSNKQLATSLTKIMAVDPATKPDQTAMVIWPRSPGKTTYYRIARGEQ